MEGGTPALCWKMREGEDPGPSLYGLANFAARGWQVPAYSLPANSEDKVIQRTLVRHGVSRDLGTRLLVDMKRSIEYFRPASRPYKNVGRRGIRVQALKSSAAEAQEVTAI